MGHAAVYSGDLPTAIRVLRGYEELVAGRAESARFARRYTLHSRPLQRSGAVLPAARAKAPGFLNGGEWLLVAQARLMTGDLTAATALFNHFLAERRGTRSVRRVSCGGMVLADRRAARRD